MDDTWLENELRLLDRSLAENAPSEVPVYQLEVACVASITCSGISAYAAARSTRCSVERSALTPHSGPAASRHRLGAPKM